MASRQPNVLFIMANNHDAPQLEPLLSSFLSMGAFEPG
jgi:hypothetical protein